MTEPVVPRDVAAWLAAAVADAERRKLPEMKALLENLSHATAALRAADWNEGPAPAGRTSGDVAN